MSVVFEAISQIHPRPLHLVSYLIYEVLRLAKEVFGNFVYMHSFLEGMENTPSCTVEKNISDLCSPDGSDTLTQTPLSAKDDDKEEEDLGKHATSDQHIFALGRNIIFIL